MATQNSQDPVELDYVNAWFRDRLSTSGWSEDFQTKALAPMRTVWLIWGEDLLEPGPLTDMLVRSGNGKISRQVLEEVTDLAKKYNNRGNAIIRALKSQLPSPKLIVTPKVIDAVKDLLETGTLDLETADNSPFPNSQIKKKFPRKELKRQNSNQVANSASNQNQENGSHQVHKVPENVAAERNKGTSSFNPRDYTSPVGTELGARTASKKSGVRPTDNSDKNDEIGTSINDDKEAERFFESARQELNRLFRHWLESSPSPADNVQPQQSQHPDTLEPAAGHSVREATSHSEHRSQPTHLFNKSLARAQSEMPHALLPTMVPLSIGTRGGSEPLRPLKRTSISLDETINAGAPATGIVGKTKGLQPRQDVHNMGFAAKRLKSMHAYVPLSRKLSSLSVTPSLTKVPSNREITLRFKVRDKWDSWREFVPAMEDPIAPQLFAKTEDLYTDTDLLLLNLKIAVQTEEAIVAPIMIWRADYRCEDQLGTYVRDNAFWAKPVPGKGFVVTFEAQPVVIRFKAERNASLL